MPPFCLEKVSDHLLSTIKQIDSFSPSGALQILIEIDFIRNTLAKYLQPDGSSIVFQQIKQLLYQKLIKAGFDALIAWRRQPRHDLDPSASAASVRRRPRFIDAVPGERPAMFCHQCHWVGVPKSASTPSCGNDRWHTDALSLYRDWAWQAQWNAVGRPRSWLPQWEHGEPPGPWELAAEADDPLPPWCLGAEAPPPPPAAPVESDEFDWS